MAMHVSFRKLFDVGTHVNSTSDCVMKVTAIMIVVVVVVVVVQVFLKTMSPT